MGRRPQYWKPAGKTPADPTEMVEMFDRIVRTYVGDGRTTFECSIDLAVLVADLLKRVPYGAGQPRMSRRTATQRGLVLSKARAELAELKAQGVDREERVNTVVRKIKPQLGDVSDTTIERWLEKRRSRRSDK